MATEPEIHLAQVQFLTVAEVAAMMRVSKMTVYRLVHGGELPAARVGRSFRVPRHAVKELSEQLHEELQRLFDAAQLQFLLQTYGPDHLCLGTDYPFDMAEPDPLGFHSALCDADRTKVLGGTAARLLHVGPLREQPAMGDALSSSGDQELPT